MLARLYATEQCRLIAKKVETREQFAKAVNNGFTRFQGYFFRRPEIFGSDRSLQARLPMFNCSPQPQNPKSILWNLKLSSNASPHSATGCCGT